MSSLLFLTRALRKLLSMGVFGLLLLLCVGSFGANAQEKDKSQAENKEITALKERLKQLEERFIQMQSRLGTIETMKGQSAGNRSEPSMGRGYGTSSQGQSSYGQPQAQAGNLGQADGHGQQGRASQNNGAADESPYGGQSPADAAPPAPAPKTKRPRRIDNEGTFLPFGDQSSLRPSQDQPPEKDVAENRGDADKNRGRRRVSTIGGSVAAVQLPKEFDNSSPQSLYQASYRMLLKPDYKKAQQGFSFFLQEYPRDKRASNAQYWLGEAYFVQKKYKLAASAYLKGYKRYPNSLKAPDSFLKLAVSLRKLGQKEAACATFKAFPAKYPNATSYVRRRHKIVQRKAGC